MKRKTRKEKGALGKFGVRSIAILVLSFIVVVGCVLSALYPAESWKYYCSLPKVTAMGEGELRIHYLDVGDGDCALLQFPDGKTVLIGGGTDDGESRKHVLRFLNALKIKKLDAVVIPTATEEGVGVLREVVKYYKIDKAYLPVAEETDGTYNALLADLQRKKIVTEQASFGVLFEDDSYTLQVLYPLADSFSYSETVLMLSYGETDVLLGLGYGEKLYNVLTIEKELKLLERWGVSIESFDVIQVNAKVDEEALLAFAQNFASKHAIFSCGSESAKPKQEQLDALASANVAVYRTDEQGRISITISGDACAVVTER